MQKVYALNETDKRKLGFLYHQSGISNRYSAIPDYSLDPEGWVFYPPTEDLDPFPSIELRMQWFERTAPDLSIGAIEKCILDKISKDEITHLITVSCTGMSAPGLDLQILERMHLSVNTFRTSVNFMGCYAAIHGLKMADAFCKSDKKAKVMIVCTELCTLHFQKENTMDNLASSLLFGDGSAAVLVVHDECSLEGLHIKNFYSEVAFGGKKHMSWQLSSTGFLMTLSGYVPELIEHDFGHLLTKALENGEVSFNEITHWCIHPGGKRILSSISKSAGIAKEKLGSSYKVLNDYGNMSSPTILFVLKEIMDTFEEGNPMEKNIFGAAFGPGLTMETFLLSDK